MSKMPFSLNVYEEMIRNIQATGKYCDYADVLSDKNNDSPFIVLRHDVEFSPERALEMQKIGNALDFKSSYFFQISNNTYNAFSKKNADIIKEIHANGNYIGLHYHMCGKTDLDEMATDIKRQTSIMSEMLGINIDRFSVHRPSKVVLKNGITVDNLIDTYSTNFFSFAENATADTVLDVKYTSDSMFRWDYGFPDEKMLNTYPKIQILLHPDYWTHTGHDNLNNFRTLLEENRADRLNDYDSECKQFREIRDALR